jgi:hypothetical protein
MTSSTRIWFGIFIVLVFVTGTFAGVLLDRAWLLRSPGRGLGPIFGGGPLIGARGGGGRGGSEGIDATVTRLTRRLELTDDQRERVRELLTRWNAATSLRYTIRRTFEIEQGKLRAEIETLLTPEQVEKFRDEFFVERGARGPRPGR